MSEYKFIYHGNEVSNDELESLWYSKQSDWLRNSILEAIDDAMCEILSKTISNNLQV